MTYIVIWQSVFGNGGCDEVNASSKNEAVAQTVEKHSYAISTHAFTQHEWDAMAQKGGNH